MNYTSKNFILTRVITSSIVLSLVTAGCGKDLKKGGGNLADGVNGMGSSGNGYTFGSGASDTSSDLFDPALEAFGGDNSLTPAAANMINDIAPQALPALANLMNETGDTDKNLNMLLMLLPALMAKVKESNRTKFLQMVQALVNEVNKIKIQEKNPTKKKKKGKKAAKIAQKLANQTA